MDILLTNDDGILAEGLSALREAIEPLGRIWVVAPEREQSATSHALTLHRPLRVRQLGPRTFAVDGTPTDCVLLACRGVPDLIEAPIALVVSGINHGANLGDDVSYSGTVAAAIEGRMMGCPAIAISLDDWRPGGFVAAGAVARTVVRSLMEHGLPDGTLVNVNVPSLSEQEIKGYKITRLGKRIYRDRIVGKTDPRGRPYYWIGGDKPTWDTQPGSDLDAVDEGYVSITPIQLDATDYRAMEGLAAWDLSGGTGK
jgi:5'-nucleotidase